MANLSLSADALSESVFIREFTRELHNKNAAVFAGAGLSTASGYVDWKGLLREIIQDLGLDPDKEHDLVKADTSFRNEVDRLGDASKSLDDLRFVVLELIEELQKL